MAKMHVTITPGNGQAADSIHAGRPHRNGIFLGRVWNSEEGVNFCYDESNPYVEDTYEQAVRGLINLHGVGSDGELILYTV